MDIYLIHRNNGQEPYWDVTVNFVIAADTPEKARFLASEDAAGRGEATSIWLDGSKSVLSLLGKARPGLQEGIVLRDFRSG